MPGAKVEECARELRNGQKNSGALKCIKTCGFIWGADSFLCTARYTNPVPKKYCHGANAKYNKVHLSLERDMATKFSRSPKVQIPRHNCEQWYLLNSAIVQSIYSSMTAILHKMSSYNCL